MSLALLFLVAALVVLGAMVSATVRESLRPARRATGWALGVDWPLDPEAVGCPFESWELDRPLLTEDLPLHLQVGVFLHPSGGKRFLDVAHEVSPQHVRRPVRHDSAVAAHKQHDVVLRERQHLWEPLC